MTTSTAALIGPSQIRIDGRAKVMGRALYPADEPLPQAAHAFLLRSTIATGRIVRIDLDEAWAVAGVLDILTHANVGDQAEPPKQQSGGATTTSMQTDHVWYAGQIIGVVVAETYEAAREAAFRIHVVYEGQPPAATFDCPGVKQEVREPGEHKDFSIGDATAAFAAAQVTVDAWYQTPTQHHNPIELFATLCAWNDDKLTIWEPSQFVYGLRGNVAGQLGIEPEDVRVISRFVGGAFGSKGGATSRTAWIAIAARRLKRPVKLVATREQGFTIATYRAETRHHLKLGAGHDGRLTAFDHEGWEVTSRPSDYNVSGSETTARMYACPNILTRVNLVHADRGTPGFMRAPPDTPYMFPLESAMDELAHRLQMDPIELRRVNDTLHDPATGLPFSSRHLMSCFDAAAIHFGWAQRNPQPGSMREGEWLIGWGCASAAYPSNISAAAARVTLLPAGTARVRIAAIDLGTGAYTVLALTAAQILGLQVEQVTVELGDSSLPPASMAAGSSHTASITHAVAKACEDLRQRLVSAAVAGDGPLRGYDPASLELTGGRLVAGDGVGEHLSKAIERLGPAVVEAVAHNIPAGLTPEAMQQLHEGQAPMLRGTGRKDVTAYAFGAQFVEVRVHRLTREIRVPRMVGAFASGRIVNRLTAHSQYMGGMIWGIGAALLEKTDIDLAHARYVNENLSEYQVPVNADVRKVEVILLPEQDLRVNPLGIKGIGEIGIVGANAAIANAVFHATGRRVRKLPIRIDDLL